MGNAQNEPVGGGGGGRVYQRRCDLSSNDEYAIYVREHISVGMSVRCCRSYEEVHEGDVGRVVKLDRDNLHDLNVQVGFFLFSINYLNSVIIGLVRGGI